MGGCVARPRSPSLRPSEWNGKEGYDCESSLLATPPPPVGDEVVSCLGNVKEGNSAPFLYHVQFRPGRTLDIEAQAIKSLSDLLWMRHMQRAIKFYSEEPQIEDPLGLTSVLPSSWCEVLPAMLIGERAPDPDLQPPSVTLTIRKCITALEALKEAQNESLLDLIVPITNVILHAPCKEARSELWNNFCLDVVRNDVMIAHLFYWALKAVATSPQATDATRRDANAKISQVVAAIAPGAQSGASGGVTPLIDIMERLRVIGEDILHVKGKEQRMAALQEQLGELNDALESSTLTPIMMLTSQKWRRPGLTSGAAMLHVPPSEAKLLSSKERAPYLIMAEVRVEDARVNGRNGGAGARWKEVRRRGVCACRRRDAPRRSSSGRGLPGGGASSSTPLTPKVVTVVSSPLKRSLSTMRGISRSRSKANLQAVDALSMSQQDKVTEYLHEQDRRPKGLFQSESWEQVVERMRETSEYCEYPYSCRNWELVPLIMKSRADDVRQEELAYRLLKWFQRVFERHKLKLWLHPFMIIATSHDGGALEAVTNAISLSELKKSYGAGWHSLKTYFEHAFHHSLNDQDDKGGGASGSTNGHTKKTVTKKSVTLNTAIMNFIWSMSAYSIVCYVLAIRDRHNGNILLDSEGHILHVDFGFMLCGAPGGKTMQKMGGFENSQGFKLTKELADVLGPVDHVPFQVFRSCVLDGMFAVREHAEELLALLQLSLLGPENSQMPCFSHHQGYPEAVMEDILERLGLKGPSSMSSAAKTDEEFRQVVNGIIDDSVDNWRSNMYDKYQYHFTGIH